jgi:hypothetical protein
VPAAWCGDRGLSDRWPTAGQQRRRIGRIALIQQADVIGRILTQLGILAELPTPLPARWPPHLPVFADN